jgi:5-methylcytosine-specific restriction endonuclease McrA
MPRTNCIICEKEFYAKPSSIKKGWGKSCSSRCQYKSFKTGVIRKCFTCGKGVYLSLARLDHSKSKKYFCNKSCQTRWRNKEFSGNKSKLWKDGVSTYRDVISNSTNPKVCLLCRDKDLRVLVVHHIDKNRLNFKIDNLVWLCHNCHHLAHFNKKAELKLILRIKNR